MVWSIAKRYRPAQARPLRWKRLSHPPGRPEHRAMFNDRTPAMSPEMPSPTAAAPASGPLPPTLPLRADTRAWRVQVWLAFGLAAALCAIGLAWLPGEDLDRAFMFMGYGFCLSSAFAVAKHVRDGQARLATTPMWGAVVWGGFGLAMALTAWGLVRMDIHPTYKAYLGVSWLFLISSAFTLAKMLRDAHELAMAQAVAAARSRRSGEGTAA